MICPRLKDLPAPPEGKTGWPWTEESLRLPEQSLEVSACGRITIVTPSFNQAPYIEETIRSILLQGYPDIEYFILDAGSTDNTVEIIRKYSRWIDFWVSEADGGQSAAINRGLRMGSGLYATWINSDDMLCKNALVNNYLANKTPAGDVVYVGDCVQIDEAGKVLNTHRGRVQSFEDLVRVRTVWYSGGALTQPEVLFPLELALRVGGLDEQNHYSMDYELWGKFFLAGATVRYTGIPFALFRWHHGQKTQEKKIQVESTLDTARALISRADFLSAEARHEILAHLDLYREEYPLKYWKQSGRLARIGLPPSVVIPTRKFKFAIEKTIGSLVRYARGSR